MQGTRFSVIPGITVIRLHGAGLNGLGTALAVEYNLGRILLGLGDLLGQGRCYVHALAHGIAKLPGYLLGIALTTAATVLALDRGRDKGIISILICRRPYHRIILKRAKITAFCTGENTSGAVGVLPPRRTYRAAP